MTRSTLALLVGFLCLWKPHQLAALDVSSPDQSDLERRVNAFCGDCHALPRPESFPRDAWYDRVRLGYGYYADSGRTDLKPPAPHEVVDYFRSRSPERVEFRWTKASAKKPSIRFVSEKIELSRGVMVPSAVANLRWAALEPEGRQELIVSDMRSGAIRAVDLGVPGRPVRLLARVGNACRTELCDLDQDGQLDLLVSDLGSFFPDDHSRGRVVWLRRIGGGGYEAINLVEGLGRVADAQVADVDLDGDPDVLVANFGWHRTGGIHLLRNASASRGLPQFELEQLDDRPGTINLLVHDFNQDRRPDFLALISQEYELVEAYMNRRDEGFARRSVWDAGDLTFGSSSIELVDLDLDGDQDILYTNGDAFDNRYVTPRHGVQWLENRGGLRFEYHRIASIPGASRAVAGDFDGDGDMDIIATAFLPDGTMPVEVRQDLVESLVFLEQDSANAYTLYSLETGLPNHVALVARDFDQDGDLDLAVGSAFFELRQDSRPLEIWWNQLKP